ncbi:MAG: hypothetical protein RMJ05_12115 [Thermomicrobium sp.]|nr:hypothetical protein [Thermomicrobium sp.]MDW8007440.1 hypothetical protein [Thermomicrobium sp.]
MSERVLERRQLTVGDVLAVFPILSRNRTVVQDLLRAAGSGNESELVAAGLTALSLLPELAPWIASLYELTPEELLARPAAELVDYIEGIVTGDDARAFFNRLAQLLGTQTGSKRQSSSSPT